MYLNFLCVVITYILLWFSPLKFSLLAGRDCDLFIPVSLMTSNSSCTVKMDWIGWCVTKALMASASAFLPRSSPFPPSRLSWLDDQIYSCSQGLRCKHLLITFALHSVSHSPFWFWWARLSRHNSFSFFAISVLSAIQHILQNLSARPSPLPLFLMALEQGCATSALLTIWAG